MGKCECYAEITDNERAELYKGIFHEDKIPIVAPVLAGRARTAGEEYTFYKVDLTRVPEEQKQAIAKKVANKFHLDVAQVIQDMAAMGIPLKSDGVIVVCCPLHTRMMIA